MTVMSFLAMSTSCIALSWDSLSKSNQTFFTILAGSVFEYLAATRGGDRCRPHFAQWAGWAKWVFSKKHSKMQKSLRMQGSPLKRFHGVPVWPFISWKGCNPGLTNLSSKQNCLLLRLIYRVAGQLKSGDTNFLRNGWKIFTKRGERIPSFQVIE